MSDKNAHRTGKKMPHKIDGFLAVCVVALAFWLLTTVVLLSVFAI